MIRFVVCDKSGNEKEVHVRVRAPEPLPAVSPPVVSSGLSYTSDQEEKSSGSDSREAVVALQNGVVPVAGNEAAAVEQQITLGAPTDPERIRQEAAATKAQAAFRGYLLQAIVRGSRIRSSDAGLEVQKFCAGIKPQDDKFQDPAGVDVSRKIMISSGNAFIRKLLAPSPKVIALLVQYDPGDPNSAVSWLGRWSLSCPWKPAPPAKKVRSQKNKIGSSQHVETDSGRPKRSVRKVHSSIDGISSQGASDVEKPRRNLKKVQGNAAESLRDNPQSELEKVKRNLRKVNEASVQQEAANGKPNQIQGKPVNIVSHVSTEKSIQNKGKLQDISDHDVSAPTETIISEKVKEEANLTINEGSSVLPEPAEVENNVDGLKQNETVEPPIEVQTMVADHTIVADHSPESNGKDENVPPSNEEAKLKDESLLSEHQKSARRASFPAKQDPLEDGIQNTPKLPSYMAATESAKAKLRGQGSPRFSQDGAETNAVTRRHSLPSSTNGKSNSASPRMQKPAQAGTKGTNKNDRSLLSSRDGNVFGFVLSKHFQKGKPVVEWRRDIKF
ncbi:IQ-DOMAIN 31-like protein [Drosera capensis]